MHDDVLYAVFAQRHGYITSEEFTNIFYSFVVDPTKDILSRLKLKLGKKKFDALKVLVANSMDQKTRMAMENKANEADTHRNKKGDLSTIQMDFNVAAANLAGENRYHAQSVISMSREAEGRYTIYQEMARGGIGRILIANDEHMGREVAMKELLPQNFGNMGRPLAPEEEEMLSHQIQMVNQRFLREATVTGRLEHPSIVPVYEIGQRKDDTLYYTMRLVKGRTLADAIYDAKTLKERLNLLPHFRDLCNAISYAHSKGVIHRDIKPENIMIGEFGETVVLDWGLAKVKGEIEEQLNIYTGNRGGKANKTVDGKALGTPSYMPPEQARGDIQSIDEISDIYSLGAVLYEILTGVPPFEGETAWETINMVLGYNVVPVTELEEKAPIELAAIAEKALSKEKKMRYQTSVDLVGDIERYMAGERITSYDYSNWELFKRFVDNHKVILSAVGLILLALVATLIFISYAYQKELVARDKMRLAIKKEISERNTANYHIAQTLNEKAYRLERDNKYLESRIFATLALKHNPGNPDSPFYSEQFAQSHPSTERLILAAKSKIYRSNVSYQIKLTKVIDVPSRILSLSVGQQGQVAALGCHDNKARVVNLDTGAITSTLAGHLGPVNTVDLSSNSLILATGSQDRAVKLWDIKSGRNVTTMLEHQDEITSVRFSPGDARLVSTSLDKSAIVWEVSSGMNIRKITPAHSIAYEWDMAKSEYQNRVARMKWYKKMGLYYSRGRVYNRRWKLMRELFSDGHRNFIYSAKFSPDGKHIVTASWDRTAKMWDIKDGNLLHTLEGHTDRLFDVEYSPMGRQLATSSWDKTIKLWDAQSGKDLATLKGHRGRVLDISYSPDGKVLASVGEDGLLLIWDVASRALLLSVKAHQDTINGVAFSKDGKHIYTAGRDKKLRIWEVVPSHRIKLFRGHSQVVNGVAISPDGKFIATGSWDKTVKIWSMETQQLVHNLTMSSKSKVAHTKRVWGVAFSPDGTLLASGSMDKTVKIWNVGTGKLLHTLTGHRGGIYRVAWAPNGKVLASASQDKTVKLWDPIAGTLIHSLDHHTERVWGISFSPDSKVIASVGNDRTVRISDVAAGPEINTLRAHQDWVTGVAFTPDGNHILSCGKKGKILKWKYPIGIKEQEIQGHAGWVNSVLVTRDGNYFITASDDRTIRFWHMKTGKPALIIYTDFKIFALDISRDGKLLLVGDGSDVKAIPVDLTWKMGDPTKLLEISKQNAGVILNGFTLELSGDKAKKGHNGKKP